MQQSRDQRQHKAKYKPFWIILSQNLLLVPAYTFSLKRGGNTLKTNQSSKFSVDSLVRINQQNTPGSFVWICRVLLLDINYIGVYITEYSTSPHPTPELTNFSVCTSFRGEERGTYKQWLTRLHPKMQAVSWIPSRISSHCHGRFDFSSANIPINQYRAILERKN